MTSPQARKHNGAAGRQRGTSLVVSLLILIAVAMLGISAAQVAINGEKAARNDRDRQLAFQAAEAALLDAELDIDGSPDAGRSRSHYFSHRTVAGFAPGCAAGSGNVFLGMCASATNDDAPVWLQVDLADDSLASTRSVPYGKFTGLAYPVAAGALPIRLPRYIIELIDYNATGTSAEAAGRSYLYRITAIGFGMREQSRVVLQSFYRKAD